MRLELNSGRKALLAGASCMALLLAAAPSAAQAQASDQQVPAAKAKDPNRVICQRIQEIGSRLATKRLCMTAAQWEEQRRRDREDVEDAQRRSIEPQG